MTGQKGVVRLTELEQPENVAPAGDGIKDRVRIDRLAFAAPPTTISSVRFCPRRASSGASARHANPCGPPG